MKRRKKADELVVQLFDSIRLGGGTRRVTFSHLGGQDEFEVKLDESIPLHSPTFMLTGTEVSSLAVHSIRIGGKEELTEQAQVDGVPALLFAPHCYPSPGYIPSIAGHQQVTILFRRTREHDSKPRTPKLFG